MTTMLNGHGALRAAGYAAALLMAVTLVFSTGCSQPGKPTIVKVPPKYTDLAGRKVAIMASADPYILSRQPAAAANAMQAVASRVVANVPDVRVVHPNKLATYQQENPEWITLLPSQLMEQLAVERLVLLDIAEYRTSEPGNRHVKRGQISAAVQVYEAESTDPDQAVLRVPVQAQFPRETQWKVGLPSASDRTVELGVLQAFALRAAGVFHEHEIEVDRGF